MNKRKKMAGAALITFLLFCMMPMTVLAKVRLSQTSMTLNAGSRQTLTVTGTTKTVSFKSSDSSIARVGSSGTVTAVKKGKAVIKVQVGKNVYKCKVTVKQPVKRVTLNKHGYYVLAKTTYTLKATVSPSSANNKKVVWKSSNTKIAKVNKAGVVTAVSAGEAVITAIAADHSGSLAKCRIYVVKNDYKGTTANVSKNAKRLLASLDRMSRQMQVDLRNGNHWTYGSKNISNLFSQAMASNHRNTTCCYYICWGLKDIGVLKPQQVVAGHPNGTIWYSKNGAKQQLKKKATITKVNALPMDLYKAGKLKPGDICIWNLGSDHDHTNVFYAYNASKGGLLWYDAGRTAGVNGYFSGSTFYFTNFGPGPTITGNPAKLGKKISYIIRLK